MEIPSLFKSSTKAVAKYMIEGDYDHLDFKLPPKMSNEIFTLVTEKPVPPYLLLQIEEKLSLSKIDISKMGHIFGIKGMVKAQKNLEALVVTIPKKEEDDNEFDLTSFMTEHLDESSQCSLKFLKISSHQRVSPLWAPSFPKILPNLETLVVPRITFHELTFSDLCQSFTNLKTLDVGTCKITSLKGISNLKYLEVLCIRDIEFRTPEDMIELFECRKLRMLDLSKAHEGGTKIVENYLKCGKVLENLTFLDCLGTDINERMLEQLMESHKNLKQVVALVSSIQSIIFPGIDLLNGASPESFLKSFRHYISIKRENYIEWMFNLILTMYEVHEERIELETRIGYMKLVCEAIRLSNYLRDVYIKGIQCLKLIASEQNLKWWTPPDIEFLASELVKIGTDIIGTKEDVELEIFKILNQESIFKCPVLNLTNICSYAISCLSRKPSYPISSIEFSILGKLHYKWTPEHIDVLFQTEEPQLDMWNCLYFLISPDNRDENIEKYRNEFKMSLVVLRRITETSQEACRFLIRRPLAKMSLVTTLLETVKIGESEIALGILINLMRIPEFVFQFDVNDIMVNARYVFMDQIQKYFDQLDQSPDTAPAFYSSASLSFLMVCTDRNDEFWSEASLLITNFCGSIFGLSEKIPKNLDVFLQSSLLTDCAQSLNDDGPKSWALLTMKTMLERSL